MSIRALPRIIIAIFLASILTFFASGAHDAQAAEGQGLPFDIDTLYATPSLIGTAPKAPVWSKDSAKIAFLWNDAGYPFRDIWVYSVESGEKKQLTAFGASQDSTSTDTGITEVIWLKDDVLAYVLNGKLNVRSADGSMSEIETDKSSVTKLAISPDGKSFSFVTGGDLWVRAVNAKSANAAEKIFGSDQAKSKVDSYEWASHSKGIAFQLTDGSVLPVRDIHYYDEDGLQVDRVSRAFPGDETAIIKVAYADLNAGDVTFFERPDDQHPIWNYGLSSDGESLFINSSDFLVKTHTVYTYDVETATQKVFYEEHDAEHLRPDWKVSWAPGNKGLLILTDRDGYYHLYHQKKAGGTPKAITQGRWEIASFKVDAKNKEIYFLANKSAIPERQLYRVSMRGGDVERVSSNVPGTHNPSFAPDMKNAVTLFSNDATPMDLYVVDLETAETVQVTKSPRPEFYQSDWANISYIEFDSDIDDKRLIGRLSLPANYDASKTYPLIVGSVYSDSVRNQYGGRTSHPTWGLDQYLVSQGYILLNVNVRGSWGQGRVHSNSQRFSYGVVDIEDLHSGVKHLVQEGYVDPERVGIWGSSYGGLMTMMSLFKKPGVYAAGIAGAPATNVYHAYPAQMWVMGKVEGDDQPTRFQNQSALYHTEGLEDPLMIIHGSKDDVVLYSDTINVVEKLIAQEKMFELVTMPGTGHGWDNEGAPERRFSFKKMVEFFNRHLMVPQESK